MRLLVTLKPRRAGSSCLPFFPFFFPPPPLFPSFGSEDGSAATFFMLLLLFFNISLNDALDPLFPVVVLLAASDICSSNPSCDDAECDEGGLFNKTETCPCDGTTNLQQIEHLIISRVHMAIYYLPNVMLPNVTSEYKITYPF